MTKKGETPLEVEIKCFKNLLSCRFGYMMDIPPWYHDIKSYNASLGHMINNRFPPFTNAKFGGMEHPRFGPIGKGNRNVFF